MVAGYMLFYGGDRSAVPSVLIGRQAPTLDLSPLPGRDATLLSDAYFDQLPAEIDVVALNVWASWCVPCRAEHPQIVAMSNMPNVQVVGLNYKDKGEDALAFLRELGDPYTAIGADSEGRTAIEYGVYGVPETFLIDRTGIIREKYVGPIIRSTFEDKVKPAIQRIAGS